MAANTVTLTTYTCDQCGAQIPILPKSIVKVSNIHIHVTYVNPHKKCLTHLCVGCILNALVEATTLL